MSTRRRFLSTCFLPGLLFTLSLSGCMTSQKKPASASSNHAFITYRDPAEATGRLRLAVKDLIDVKGSITTAGSEYLAKNGQPAARDAKCMAIARERGVEIVGKTNLTEFAITIAGINAYFGTPWNPQSKNERLIPGGSSSGSAVAVATGQADIAFGTDTAGSIRVPAACCGVAGLKTTFGLVSLDGVFPIAPDHLDTVGPMARNVAGLVQGMDLLQRGFAARYRAATAARPSGKAIKVGRLYIAGTDPKIDEAVDEALAAGGFQVVVLDPTLRAEWEQAERDTQTIALANTWFNDRQFLNKDGVTVKTKTVIAAGQLEYANNYRAALQRQVRWQRTVRRILQTVDFIALPTLKKLPPEIPLIGRSAVFEARIFAMQNTAPVNLAGNPAIAIPIPVADKTVPRTSVQLIGRRLSEAELLNAGRLIEAGVGINAPAASLAAAERR